VQTIGNFPDLASAEMARAFLEAAGIPATIPDAEIAGLDWRLGTALGGVRLQVAPDHVQAATHLLERQHAAALEDGDQEVNADDVCPTCKSPDIKPDRHRKLLALSMLFFPLLLIAIPVMLLSRGRHRCCACGKVWRQANHATGQPQHAADDAARRG
jgi:hypothetical protein